jgi:hypothetical protein
MKPFYKTPGGMIFFAALLIGFLAIYWDFQSPETPNHNYDNIVAIEPIVNHDSAMAIIRHMQDSVTTVRNNNLDALVSEIDYGEERMPVDIIYDIETAYNIINGQKAIGNTKAESAIKKIKSLKSKVYPILRKRYVAQTSKLLWEHNIECECFGAGCKKIFFTGVLFASNKSIKEYYETLAPILIKLRFKSVAFKWYSMDDEYSYYDLDPEKDSE